MKKIFSPIMATAFALMLTNCSNNDIVTEQPVQPTAKQISLKADIVGSKLSMSDDYKMTWDDKDKIGVYIMKGSTVVCANEPFEYDAATKTFTGNVALEDATSYEWAAVYPYTTGASSYLWNKASLFTSSNMTTAQDGTREDLLNFDIMASNVVTKLGSESVHLIMAHQTSIIKINVKNGSEETITPSSLNFDVGQTISGRTVYYDFGAEDVVGNPTSKKNYVTLSLSDNTPIAKDAQFTAYFMVLPFSAAAGSKINVTLNDIYVCEKTMPSIFSFDAGSYYETTVTVKQPDAISVTPESLSWAADATDAKTVTVTSSGAWTASIDNTADFTLTPTSGANGDTFTVTPKEANTGTTAKTATVTLTRGTATATVTCSQAAAGAAGETTVSISSFTSVNGSFEGGVVSYTSAKGGAGTAPGVYSNIIRLYQGNPGGNITVSVPAGYKIKSASIKSAMTTTIKYELDNDGSMLGEKDVAVGEEYNVSSVNVNSVTFHCFGSDKNHRLYVEYLSVTYEAE